MTTKAKPKTEQFDVRNYWTNEVQFTATIECAPTAHPTVKLGLAVKWGFANKANLHGANLDGANLHGANLDGANLHGANLDGASLVGANLVGANLHGASLDGARLVGASLDGASLDGALIHHKKIKRLIAIVPRQIGGYVFNALETDGGEIWIMAGCRWFTPEQYIAHVAAEYPDTSKAEETLDIINYILMRAQKLGVKAKALETVK